MLALLASCLLLGSVTQVAKDAMDCKFTVCGVPYQFKDRKIDWDFNPTYNGYREWPWQFARMNFLPDLAAYYRKTGDEKAAETFVAVVTSFIDQTVPPPPDASHGATKSWRTLDTGLRASNWVDSYFAFTNSPAVTADFKEKVFRSLEDHLRRLEPAKTSNNWRIMELRGLVDLTLAFPNVARAAERRAAAERELADMLTKQLYPDGFQFELSTGYHGILDGDYAALARRYRQYGATPPEFLEKGIELAFELYPHLTRPDRILPSLNDAGVVPIRRKMQTAAKLYPHRADYRWFATNGRKGKKPDYLSYAFPYSGAVVFRDSWAEDAVWGYVDMSPFGRGHQHEDKLNFLLFAYGKNMLCEGGNYAYDSSDMRKYVISTRAHNTIRIDGKDQNARRTWQWTDDKLHQKADLAFSTSPAKDVAKSSFALGYGKEAAYDDSVTHTRTVEFVKDRGEPFFRITDELAAKDGKEHSYEQMWHLEKCELRLADDAFTADFGDGVTLEAKVRSDNGRFVDMIGTKEPIYQGWMPISPPGPHEHRPIHTPVLKGTFKGATTIVAEFRPHRAPACAAWPEGKDPRTVSDKLTDLFLSTRPESYKPEGYASPQGYNPNGYGGGRHVQYSVVSLWVNALECARMKGDKAREEKLIRLYDDFLPGGRLHGICSHPYHVDFTIFGSIALQIYLQNGDRRCLEHGLSYADTQWTPPCEGTLTVKHAHPKEVQEKFWSEGYTPQTRLWIDDMYMIIAIQSQAFRATGDRKYIDRTAKEMCLYIDELQVKKGKDRGLFYHAPDVPFVWGRGAGWMAAGMSLVLEYVKKDSPYHAKILRGYRRMMSALLARQRPNGMWNQLVGDPKSWEETSCTAMYGYAFAMGVKNSLLDAKKYGPAARKAYLALCDRLDARGNVQDVCCGTGKRNDYQYYLDRPHVHGDPHGQCALMWMCRTFMEMEGMKGVK